MPAFVDASGQTWPLVLTFWDICRIKRQTGFHVCEVFTPEGAAKLDDPVLLLEILAAYWEPHLRETGQSIETLAKRLVDAGEQRRLVRTFLEAVVDYLPPENRPTMKAALAIVWAELERPAETTSTPEIEQAVKTAVQESLRRNSTTVSAGIGAA